jgi:hypothetical protein
MDIATKRYGLALVVIIVLALMLMPWSLLPLWICLPLGGAAIGGASTPRKRKPSLAELEGKTRQMEAESLLTPESRYADNEAWIAATDKLLNPPTYNGQEWSEIDEYGRIIASTMGIPAAMMGALPGVGVSAERSWTTPTTSVHDSRQMGYVDGVKHGDYTYGPLDPTRNTSLLLGGVRRNAGYVDGHWPTCVDEMGHDLHPNGYCTRCGLISDTRTAMGKLDTAAWVNLISLPVNEWIHYP